MNILEKAKIRTGGNTKLGSTMGSWALLFGNIEWYSPELGRSCRGTCKGNCKGCFDKDDPKKSACYVAKSYTLYTNRNEDGTPGDITKSRCTVKYGHMINTIAMTEHRRELEERLDVQLTNKKKKFDIVRINESGELTCKADFRLWCRIADRHPETIFYLYTKNYKAIEDVPIPKNLFVNLSIWHDVGIKEYNKMKTDPQIRAFVLVDEEYTKDVYAKKGVVITSMCAAYDAKGKMNHSITCDKCKKCFRSSNKVVGCYQH